MPRRGLNHSLYVSVVVALFILVGCSYMKKISFLPRGVDRRLRDEEVVRIDKDVYVKVLNPEAQTGDPFSQYLYVSAHEYLANPEAYDVAIMSTATSQEEEWKPVLLETESPPVAQEWDSTEQVEVPFHLKKRLMLVPFSDLANPPHQKLSDIFSQKLASKIESISDQAILVDADIMNQGQRGKRINPESLDSMEMVRLASQTCDIHAIVVGTINHVFTSSRERMVKGKLKTTYAVAEISARLIDASSGAIKRQWEKRNPIFDSEEKGDFSQEKARLKAIELIASELGRDIIEELKKIDWYARIASVDGNQVYISAGKRSGVRVGDTFSVSPAASPDNPKGEIRIAALFGIDASVGDITSGDGFRANDLVRPVFQ